LEQIGQVARDAVKHLASEPSAVTATREDTNYPAFLVDVTDGSTHVVSHFTSLGATPASCKLTRRAEAARTDRSGLGI
jgi:hypothetical protein